MKKLLFLLIPLIIIITSCWMTIPEMDCFIFIRFPKEFENAEFVFDIYDKNNDGISGILLYNDYALNEILINHKGNFYNEYIPENEILFIKQVCFKLDRSPLNTQYFDIIIKVITIDNQDYEYNLKINLTESNEGYQEYFLGCDEIPMLFYYYVGYYL